MAARCWRSAVGASYRAALNGRAVIMTCTCQCRRCNGGAERQTKAGRKGSEKGKAGSDDQSRGTPKVTL